MSRTFLVVAGMALATGLCTASLARAETVMQQCGQQYQAAKAAGTLNGMSWNQFRTDCSTRLKAQPASAAPAANPLNPAPAAPAPAAPAPTTAAAAPSKTAKPPASAGRAAMLTRERQCGSEWRAQKVSLVAATPGLTWPKYWSQCNTRLKAAGQ